jgi:protein SCO1/2
MKDKIYVADFFFTSCGSICPKMTNNMKTVYDHFATNDKIRFLSHTVMPEIDSIKVLNRYASAKGIDSRRWHLLTGNKDEIYHLAKKEYYAGDTLGYYQTGNEFLHTENFILLDQQRRIRGIYNGTLGVEMNRLIEDIETLLKE